DDLLAVDARVDQGKGPQRLDRRLDEERHDAEADAVLLLERLLVLRPQRRHGGQVGLVEGGQDGGAVLGGDQAFGDALADRRHALAGFAAGSLLRRGDFFSFRRCRLAFLFLRGRGRGNRLFLPVVEVGDDVFLGDAAAAARPRDLVGVHALFRSQLPGGG